ncbi:hypothetical protein PFISCL1PPCAC_4774, partial [Pristionchus fissidentatus]
QDDPRTDDSPSAPKTNTGDPKQGQAASAAVDEVSPTETTDLENAVHPTSATLPENVSVHPEHEGFTEEQNLHEKHVPEKRRGPPLVEETESAAAAPTTRVTTRSASRAAAATRTGMPSNPSSTTPNPCKA